MIRICWSNIGSGFIGMCLAQFYYYKETWPGNSASFLSGVQIAKYMSAPIICVCVSVLKFWSCLLQGKKVGSADMKRVWVRRQRAGCLSSNLKPSCCECKMLYMQIKVTKGHRHLWLKLFSLLNWQWKK